MGGWNPCFCRSFNDWKVKAVESFLVRLHGRAYRDVEDLVPWTERKGQIISQSIYNALEPVDSSFPPDAFGMCGCSLILASLLGRQHEVKL